MIATEEWKKCRDVTFVCNQMEDQSIPYVASCKTGPSALKFKLKNLYIARDYMNKSESKASTGSSLASRQSSTTVTLTYTTFTINSSDTSAITNSTFFINCVSWIVIASEAFSSAGNVEGIGSDSTIRYDEGPIALSRHKSLFFCSVIWLPGFPTVT